MPIEPLLEVLSPPLEPIEKEGNEPWELIESKIGVVLPADYKDFINAYGTVYITGFLWVYNPFSSDLEANLLEQIHAELTALIELKEELGEECIPFPIYPEHGGVLPWGATFNGDTLFWLTEGEPNTWPVIVAGRNTQYERWNLSMTEFLVKILSRQIRSEIFPRNFPPEDRRLNKATSSLAEYES